MRTLYLYSLPFTFLPLIAAAMVLCFLAGLVAAALALGAKL